MQRQQGITLSAWPALGERSQPAIISNNVFLACADAALAPHLPSGGGAPVPDSLVESDSADGPSSFVRGTFDSPIQLQKSLFSFVLGRRKKNTNLHFQEQISALLGDHSGTYL